MPKSKLDSYIYHKEDAGVIYCGDCLEILPLLEDNSIDLVLTDPPYGLNINYGEYDDTRENLQSLIKSFLPWCRDNANIVAISTDITPLFLYPRPDWVMSCMWNTTGSYGYWGYAQWFPIVLYGRDISGMGKVNGVLKSDVVNISGGSSVGFMRSGEGSHHPCPKPLNIIRHLVNRLSNSTNLILDPFLGSGTTAVAAKQLGRKFIGIEIEEKYCEIAKQRLAQEVLAL